MNGPNISIDQHLRDVERYAKQRHRYEKFANTLEEILKKAGALYAPLCIVQVRAKTVSSFAEKIVRKDKYADPLVDMTDLCGGRIIVHFQSQALKICRFIKDNFIIDEANSIDVSSSLETANSAISRSITLSPPGKAASSAYPLPKILST